MEELVVRLNACLPLLMATIGSDAGIEVDVFEVVALRDISQATRPGWNRSRESCHVPCRASPPSYRAKKCVRRRGCPWFQSCRWSATGPLECTRNYPRQVRTGTSIRIVAIWHVSAVLLDQLIGNRVASEFVTGDHREMILRRELSLIIQRELSCGAVVGVVLGGWSIEIVVRHVSCPAETPPYFSPKCIRPAFQSRPWHSCLQAE